MKLISLSQDYKMHARNTDGKHFTIASHISEYSQLSVTLNLQLSSAILDTILCFYQVSILKLHTYVRTYHKNIQ